MDYEIFIWLEPAFRVVHDVGAGGLICCGICACMALLLFLILWDLVSKKVDMIKKSLKVLTILFCISLLLILASSPFYQFTDVYKKVLIYRGINSTLVDKGVDTADKALDVLNAKLDKEMTAIKAEKE